MIVDNALFFSKCMENGTEISASCQQTHQWDVRTQELRRRSTKDKSWDAVSLDVCVHVCVCNDWFLHIYWLAFWLDVLQTINDEQGASTAALSFILQ